MKLSPETEAEMIRRGATVTANPVRYPGDAPVEIETRMAWSEKQFQAEVEKLAKKNGWKSYHTWLSVRSQAGFPDLVLTDGARLLFAELKTQKGKLSTEQKDWIWLLEKAGQKCHVWRPADWEQIEAALARPQ